MLTHKAVSILLLRSRSQSIVSFLVSSSPNLNLSNYLHTIYNGCTCTTIGSRSLSTTTSLLSQAKEKANEPGPEGGTSEGHDLTHFSLSNKKHPLDSHPSDIKGVKRGKIIDPFWENPTPHPIYKEEDLVKIQKTHYEPQKMYDRVALFAVKCLRGGFDFASRYHGPGGAMTKRDWLNRCLFLETVAGVPGMVAGMCRHLKSLRTLKRDYGWIHTLLEEAENERMHLLIFMGMKNPNILFRLMVMGGQGVFFNMFFLTYMVSPRTCHRFVGYLEEEAVKTYTGLLQDLDAGHLGDWGNEAAPKIGAEYYKLGPDAVVRDVVACIRADEANHRDVNHTFAGLDPDMDMSPFISKYKPGTGSTPRRS